MLLHKATLEDYLQINIHKIPTVYIICTQKEKGRYGI